MRQTDSRPRSGSHDDANDRPRPLREKVCEIDREILGLLMRRHNILSRIARTRDRSGQTRAGRDRIDPHEERFIRESWEHAVSRVSTDPLLASQFFLMMQELDFLPPPSEDGPSKATIFGLAPAQKPVDIDTEIPCDSLETRLWSALAAYSGSGARIPSALCNDALLDCLRMLAQLGSGVRRDGADGVYAEAGSPAGTPDRVLHVGNDPVNFYISLVHYLGRPGHTKFTGGPALKLADFSPLRRFLPELGTRVIGLVPKSNGLPVRIECSGMLPDTVVLPADLPMDFVRCFVAAAPFFEKDLAIDCAALPAEARDRMLGELLPLLSLAGITVEREGDVLRTKRHTDALPETPSLHMDLDAAAVLLALGAVLGGRVRLKGLWPDSADAASLLSFLEQTGVQCTSDAEGVTLTAPEGYVLSAERLRVAADLPERFLHLPCALACCQALINGKADLPAFEGDRELPAALSGLASACELDLQDDVLIRPEEEPAGRAPVWTAPSSRWLCALALAACCRPSAGRGYALNNPGLVTEIFPGFWNLYNALPAPRLRREEPAGGPQGKERRRIRTTAAAQLVPRDEEDY